MLKNIKRWSLIQPDGALAASCLQFHGLFYKNNLINAYKNLSQLTENTAFS